MLEHHGGSVPALRDPRRWLLREQGAGRGRALPSADAGHIPTGREAAVPLGVLIP